MTDNTQTVEESTSKLEELIEFPATLTFKFVGNNNDAASTVIAAFFKDDLGLEASITAGRTSRTGKYITFNVTTTVADKDLLLKIYKQGAELPHIMHVPPTPTTTLKKSPTTAPGWFSAPRNTLPRVKSTSTTSTG